MQSQARIQLRRRLVSEGLLLLIAGCLLAMTVAGLAQDTEVADVSRTRVPSASETPTGPPVDQAAPADSTSTEGAEAAPARPTPTPIPFSSPFSLNDCLNLLQAAVRVLPETPDQPVSFETQSFHRLLNSVSDYLKNRDEMHASLVGYEWDKIGRADVETGVIENIEIDLRKQEEPPKDMTAISFRVERGDVLVHNMKVFDEDDDLVAEFRLEKPVQLRHSLPKREFFFLWRPTDIERISIAASKATPEREEDPRLFVLAGRTDKPEHGKAAIWFIDQAQIDIREGRLVMGRQKLARAQTEIRQFRETVRSER